MKKPLLVALGIATLALGGVALGAKSLVAVAPIEADAEGAKGTITLDLTNSRTDGDYWYTSACNISINFHSSDWATQEWGAYVALAKDQMEVEIPYDLSFTPDQFSIVRYAGSFTESAWEGDRWGAAADAKWGEVANLTFAANAHGYFADYSTVYVGTYALIHSSNGGGTGVWGDKMNLDSVKLNGSSHCEYFATNVVFAAEEEFGIKLNGNWYTKVSKSDYVTAKFSGGNGSNIKCLTAGTYALYFDSSANSLYITDPVLAEADEWAQEFLGANCTATKAGWSTLSTSYAALSSEAKALFVAEAHVDHDAETASYRAAAVQRYDYVLELYGIYNETTNPTGYVDFIGRAAKLSLAKSASSTMVSSSNNAAIWAVIGITLGAATLLGVTFAFRKRRQD